MQILNLKSDFAPLGAGVGPVQVVLARSRVFSGGETDVRLVGDVLPELLITTRLNTSADLMELLMATDAVRTMGAEKIHLFVPYLPYARQDRVVEVGEAFSLRVFANIVNLQGYASVRTFDAHSDVGPALLWHSRNITNHTFVKKVLEGKSNYVIVSPDAGAFKKVSNLCKETGYQGPPVVCTKARGQDGAIEAITMSVGDFEGKDTFIVDDICDGGRTFIALAAELKARRAGTVNLIVSHGIFSYGEDPLRQGGVDHIYTTDSVKVINSPYITQIPLCSIL